MTRFEVGSFYLIDPIVQLAWRCEYESAEIESMLRCGIVRFDDNGILAEFSFNGDYNRKGDPLWRCVAFEQKWREQ